MQREEHPLHRDVELLFESVNTPGTEVAPRSDVIREHFQDDGISHYHVSFNIRTRTVGGREGMSYGSVGTRRVSSSNQFWTMVTCDRSDAGT